MAIWFAALVFFTAADVDPADHKAIKSKYLRLLAEKTKPEAALKIVADEYDADVAEIKKIVKYQPPKPKDPKEKPAKKSPQPERPARPRPSPDFAEAGDIRVAVQSAAIVKVQIDDFGRLSLSKEPQLRIELRLRNTSDTKKIDYKTWAASATDLASIATLTDEFGNTYKASHFGIGTKVQGQVDGTIAVHPDKVIGDVLVFEPPIDKAKRLKLQLPGKNIGHKDTLEFTIPTSFVD